MGDLDLDTAVDARGDGRYRARLSSDWEIWGPNGGYVASVALRAAAAVSAFERPASFSCHYLSVARFGEVDVEVRVLRRARRAESLAVSVTQEGVPVLEAIAWFVADGDGLVHDAAPMPAVAMPVDLAFLSELLPPDAPSPFRFWRNFELKPLEWWTDPAESARERPDGARLVPVRPDGDLRGPGRRRLPVPDPARHPQLARRHAGPPVGPAVDGAEPRR